MSKKEKSQAVPSELLSKEFLSLFKIKEEVSQFLKDLHAQVLEQMLQGELEAHLGYQKHSTDGNSRNGSFSKKIQTEYGEKTIEVPGIVTVILLLWSFPNTRAVAFPSSGS